MSEKRFLCKIGIHKWSTREVHLCEKIKDDSTYMLAAVIERCICGESRFAIGGGKKPTVYIVPDKYLGDFLT